MNKFPTVNSMHMILAAAVVTGILGAAQANAIMVHGYGMNEGSGVIVADAVTNGFDGVFNSGKDTNTDWVAGITGFGVQMDASHGVQEGIVFGTDASFENVNEGTIMLWLKANGNESEGRLFQKGQDGDSPNQYNHLSVMHNNSQQVVVEPQNGVDGNLNVGGLTLGGGVWHHVAWSYSVTGGTQALYFDGVEVASAAFTSPLLSNTNRPFMVGHDPVNTGRMFEGVVDEVKIFDNFMTAAEVQVARTNYFPDQGGPPDPPPPAGPPIVDFDAMSNITVFTFNTVSGLQYNLEIATDPGTSNYTYSGLTVVGDGGSQTLYDPDGFSTGKLYRVTEWP